jgi:hypothetical protein
MNIPEDVRVAASNVQDHLGQGSAYQVVAEWARKEALREAAAVVHDVYTDGYYATLDAIRTLAGG